jgi:uncharacterized protein YdhG (YjbR/CyaY superfamily)
MGREQHEGYLAGVSAGEREKLETIQRLVEETIPEAKHCIGYRMPAFRAARIFIYFASFQRHIGVYPPVTKELSLIQELAKYRGPKGNLSFPHREELPTALLIRVIRALHKEYG